MVNLIKPGTKYDFIGKQKVFISISIAFIMASIVSLIVFGFNLGIDFKGGSKMIVAFNKSSNISRKAIKEEIKKTVVGITKKADSEVGVQDFEVGAGSNAKEIKYLIYTEVTSLLNKKTNDKIKKAFLDKFGKDTRVEAASEEDKFYIVLPKSTPVLDSYKRIKKLFAVLGFKSIVIKAQKEEEIDIDFYKQLNLEETEVVKGGGKKGTDWDLKIAEFQQKKNEKLLPGLKDDKYTVTILQLNSLFETHLKQKFGKAFIRIEEATTVSASVGSHMFNEGLLAILYAIIGILIYISLRFDIRFAPGAVVALIHDVVITMGVFSVLQIKFSLPIVAALLTIIGYSLNDTIVVYDRIRENMERIKAALSASIINKSVNETLSRTLMTSITTMLVVISILVLGGGLIRNFAFALFIGIIVGTYSSVFIASPFALFLNKYLEARRS